MTIRYCGPGGDNANSGLTYALRKLTLNGVEDSPVAAGDLCHVAPGTYRETLTVDISGSAGNLIEYRGDYSGVNTDGVGGIVRVTGSDNDQTATRANFVALAAQRDYRKFTGLHIDGCSSGTIITNGVIADGWEIDRCHISSLGNAAVDISGSTTVGWTISNCFITTGVAAHGIRVTFSSTISNVAHLFQNNIIMSRGSGIQFVRVGGATVKNCRLLLCAGIGVQVATALAVGQTNTVNNCIIERCTTGLAAINVGEITSNYNNLYGNQTNYTNVTAGANDNTYLSLSDSRWFFQLVNAGAGPYNAQQLITPFDLSAASQLVNLAGLNPPATDMRGTAIQGAQREFGPLEYDSTLKIRGGINKSRIVTGH